MLEAKAGGHPELTYVDKDITVADMNKEIQGLTSQVEILQGVIKADDDRLHRASVRVWGNQQAWGCDTPERMADIILIQREKIKELEDRIYVP